jgi:hypothetical protein
MAAGYVLPSSIYLGGAAGLLSSGFYAPNTNTNSLGNIEGIQVVGSLASDALAALAFITPNPVPTGTPKLRSLFQANATSGVAKYTVKDGNAGNSTNPGTAAMTTEGQTTLPTWTTQDVLVESKVSLNGLGSPAVGDLLVVGIIFNTSGWTLTAVLNGMHMLVWE